MRLSPDWEPLEPGGDWPQVRMRAELSDWIASRREAVQTEDLPAILMAMIDACREASAGRVPLDEPVDCRLGRFMLRAGPAFAIRNPTTLTAGLYELQRLVPPGLAGTAVVKTGLVQAAAQTSIGPLSEAMFYCFLGDVSAVEGLRIPRLHAVNPYDAEVGQLFLEYLPKCRPVTGFAEMCGAARMLGRFSGSSHRLGLHRAEWLRRSSLSLFPHQLADFDRMVEQVPLTGQEKTAIGDGFAGFLEGFLAVRAAHAGGLPALCHGDLHAANFVAMDGGDFAIIDWAWVNAGRIGDDLAVLAYPWLVTSPLAGPGEDFEAADARLLAAYLDGAGPYLTGPELASVPGIYRLRSIAASLAMARHYRRWMLQPQDRGVRHRRALRVGRFYSFMAGIARSAAAHLR